MQVTHVRGHQFGDYLEARGNRWADQAARQGRYLHAPGSLARRAMRAALRSARHVLRWLVAAHLHRV
eukprot:8504247-Pyramimonas_sp.AAC.1